MGIKGLLPFLKKSCRQASLNEFYGQTVAVDASCWLHRGAFACADRLANSEDTNVYVKYCEKQIRILQKFRLHIILVFDGASLPAKKRINQTRNEKRQALRAKGKLLMAEGKNAEAYDCFKQSTQINFDMVSEVIKACSKFDDVDCIVAPYEADAQLAYFTSRNLAQLVITEDSDLILFGCPKIMFKLDGNGSGYLYERHRLLLSLNASQEQIDRKKSDYDEKISRNSQLSSSSSTCSSYNDADDFEAAEFRKFRRSCILSGCDYFEGLDGVGLIKATKFFNKASRTDLTKILPLIGLYLRMPTPKVDKNFIENFIDAENTFLYQPIFDVLKKKRLPLNEVAQSESLPECYELDMLMDPDTAIDFASGNLNPHSKRKQNDFDLGHNRGSRSIWSDAVRSPEFKKMKLSFREEFSTKSAFSQTTIHKEAIRHSRVVAKRSRRSESPNILEEYKSAENMLEEYREQETSNASGSKISKYFANNLHTTLDMLEEMAKDEQESGSGTRFDSLITTAVTSEDPSCSADQNTKSLNDSTEDRKCLENVASDIELDATSPQMSFKTAELMSKFRKRPQLLSYPCEKRGRKSETIGTSKLSTESEIVSSKDSGFADEDSPSTSIKVSTETVVDLTLVSDEDSCPTSIELSKLTNNGCRTSGLRKRNGGSTKNSTLKQISIRESLLAFSCKKH